MPDFFQAANPDRQLDQNPQPGIRRSTVRACVLRRPALALAAIPQTSPSQRNFSPGRLLLPAAMPGNCFDRPAFSLAYPGSVAAAAPPHSPRPPHGGSRQANLPRSARRPRSPAPRPLRKNRRLDRKTRFCFGTGSHHRPRPAMGMPRGLVLRSLHDSEPGQHSAAHPRSFPDASHQLCRFDQHSLPRLRRARRPRRSLCHRESSRLPHSALRCWTQEDCPSTRRHAPTAPAERR